MVKVCPLINGSCLEDKCGLWFHPEDECSLRTLAWAAHTYIRRDER
ncbi:MAG: hypothetical protein ACE5Z5_12555 [Candidatus Bathyarchaeia archaeon]